MPNPTKPRKGKKKLFIALLSLVLAVTLVADILMFGVFASALDKAFVDNNVDQDLVDQATANGLAVAQQIEEEGAVLLENDGALPLSAGKINLLGYASCSPVYGGTGSGGSTFLDNRVDFVSALTQAGFEVNSALTDMYAKFAEGGENTFSVDFSINEPAATEDLAADMGQTFMYTGDCSFDALKEYSDTAVIVFSRKGGEGNDLPTIMTDYTTYAPDQSKHYLELNSAELSLLEQAKATFSKVVVLINTGNAMELGFLDGASQGNPDAAGDIDAALWVGDVGDVGTVGVANILNGTVNPSGRTADIYPYAVETIPSYYNFDTFEYTNSNSCFEAFDSHPAYLLEYQEGIYVGYRYYETRTSYDYVTREGEQVTGAGYDDVVQYPFGYGLSYTDFTWEVTDATASGSVGQSDVLTFTVEVTNTGSVAGKDVVELYYTAPYYTADQGGSGIQKAQVVLGAYAKTELLQPGESGTVTLTLPVENMASYDTGYYTTTGSYVLEAGDYTISLRTDSHTVNDNMTYTYTVDSNLAFADEGSAKAGVDVTCVGKRSTDAVTAVNHFDDVAGDVAYMTRDTWEIVPGSSQEATEEQLEAFRTALEVDQSYVDESDTAPTFGADNGLTLNDLKGKDYDDPMWEDLLDQLTIDDINLMVGANGWGCPAVESVGKAQTYDMDGPAALSYVFDAFAGTCTYKTVTYPCEVVTASTWNTELAKAFGDAISQEGQAWNISGWYAPGANMHRNPFTGRNFEYYSEDPCLAGTMCASAVGAAQANGMYCYVKHFALNERETQRHYGLCTWANEQSMREIYFVPFEMAVKDGNSTGIMSAYNNLGTTWAGGSKALLTDVLRNEWGFQGTVLTDNNEEHGFMDIEVAITAGGSTLLYGFGQKTCDTLAQTASGQLLMREAAHQYLYTVANSYATDNVDTMATWRVIAIAVSAVLYVACIGGIAALAVTGRKKQSA